MSFKTPFANQKKKLHNSFLQPSEQQPGWVPEEPERGVQAEHLRPGQGARQGLQEGPPLHQAKAGLPTQAGEEGGREGGEHHRTTGAQEGASQHCRWPKDRIALWEIFRKTKHCKKCLESSELSEWLPACLIKVNLLIQNFFTWAPNYKGKVC